jgi:hypothetical protein
MRKRYSLEIVKLERKNAALKAMNFMLNFHRKHLFESEDKRVPEPEEMYQEAVRISEEVSDV